MTGENIVDATVTQSSVRYPREGQLNDKNPEVGWTKKSGDYIYGYKSHISCDSKHYLIIGAVKSRQPILRTLRCWNHR